MLTDSKVAAASTIRRLMQRPIAGEVLTALTGRNGRRVEWLDLAGRDVVSPSHSNNKVATWSAARECPHLTLITLWIGRALPARQGL